MVSRKSELEPIDPRTAQQLFLDHKETECTESTVRNHRYHTNEFVAWCEENDVDNLNDLTGRDLQALRLWRKESGDINLMTLNNYMCSLRVFIKWCGSIEAVSENLYDKVMVPRISPDDQQADEPVDAETANEILAYLSTFHYASVEHAMLGLLWESGMRIGAANGLDVDDVDLAEEQLQLVHKPSEGTTLKNGSGGERPVAITSDFADVLDAYIERIRKDVPDDHGRDTIHHLSWPNVPGFDTPDRVQSDLTVFPERTLSGLYREALGAVSRSRESACSSTREYHPLSDAGHPRRGSE